MIVHDTGYSRYSMVVVPASGKMQYTQNTRNTHEPRTTTIVGTTVLPNPRAAAMVLSIKAESAYEKHITASRCLPASMTAASPVKMDKKAPAQAKSSRPHTSPDPKEYRRLTK